MIPSLLNPLLPNTKCQWLQRFPFIKLHKFVYQFDVVCEEKALSNLGIALVRLYVDSAKYDVKELKSYHLYPFHLTL